MAGLSRRRMYSGLLPGMLLSLVSCGNSDQRGACTVEQNSDGSATITCDDGTSASVAPGQDGQNGAPGNDGERGVDGASGTDGLPGANGSSCSIVEESDGTRAVSCSDGTRSVVPPGVSGYGGAGGQGGDDSSFYGASSFTVAFAELQDPVSFSSTGDYAYIPEGEAPFYNFLLAPVRLPEGAEVRSMTCRYYDNTSLADLEADAALIEKPFNSESGVERIRTPMGKNDFVFSQIEDVVATPDVPLVVDNVENTYFIRVYWFTGDTASSAVRFYGCGLDLSY